VSLANFKAAALGLRSLHRIYLQLKRQNDNYEAVHEIELAQSKFRRETVDKVESKVYYQSDAKLAEEELKEKLQRLAATGDYADLQP